MDNQILKAEKLSMRGQRRIRRNLLEAFLDACKAYGAKTKILTDGDGRVFTYGELRQAAFALSSCLRRLTPKKSNIGILLPTGAGAVIALLSVHAAGCTPAMLNFSAGIKNLKAAIKTAPLETVMTARKFIDVAGLSSLIAELSEVVNVVYLEDLKEDIGIKSNYVPC